ncbi:MAG: hypothetical protein R2911_20060 [Caldilineaceae bacterium]
MAAFRARFVHDDPDLIYLDGNSLGRLPRLRRRRWTPRCISSGVTS